MGDNEFGFSLPSMPEYGKVDWTPMILLMRDLLKDGATPEEAAVMVAALLLCARIMPHDDKA